MKPLTAMPPIKAMPEIISVSFRCWSCSHGWQASGKMNGDFVACPVCGGSKITHIVHYKKAEYGR